MTLCQILSDGRQRQITVLTQGLVSCLTISCLSCISLAIKPFLYSSNVLIVLFYSSATLSDCICFKDATVAVNDSIQTHSKKDPNTVKRKSVVINDWTRLTSKILMENTQKKKQKKKKTIAVFVGKTYYHDIGRTIFGNSGKHFFFKGIMSVRIFSSLFSVYWNKKKNHFAWLNTVFELEPLYYKTLPLSWKKRVFPNEQCLRTSFFFHSIVFG